LNNRVSNAFAFIYKEHNARFFIITFRPAVRYNLFVF
jgi:hypothetical protein